MRTALKIFILPIILFLAIPTYAGTVTTSGVTAQTIINIARADLHEVTASFWNDSELIDWTDEAVNEIVSKTRCMETAPFSIALVQDDYDYDISTSFLDIEAVMYDSGETTSKTRIYALERVDLRILGHITETGAPKKYCIWNDDLIVWPVPGSTQSGTSVYIYAISTPSGVTTSTSPIETPSYFDPAVVDYVKAKAFLKDNRISIGNYYMSLFNQRLQNYFENIVNRRNIPEE